MTAVHPIKSYREAEGLTQTAAAKRLRVSRTTLARWETGSRKVDYDLVPRISKQTGIPASKLRPDMAKTFEAAE